MHACKPERIECIKANTQRKSIYMHLAGSLIVCLRDTPILFGSSKTFDLYVSDSAYVEINAFDYGVPCLEGERVVSLFQISKTVGMRQFPYVW